MVRAPVRLLAPLAPLALLVLLALAAAAPAAAAQAGGPGAGPGPVPALPAALSTGDDAAARARELGDGAPIQLFFELARPATLAALEALEEALHGLKDEERARAAYGAFGLFRGTAHEAEAVRRLGRRAFSERRPAHARAAVHALSLLGPAAEGELARVVERHGDAACRALALRPLLFALAAAGDEAACRLVLANADLELGVGPGVAAVLERCQGRESELMMARELRQSSRSAAWKQLLIAALATREGPIASGALQRRLSDADRGVRIAALSEIARRDARAAVDALRALAREGDELLVREAILALAALRDADPGWTAELAGFARSRSVESRRAVVAALSGLRTRESLWLLHRLMDDEDWRVQVEAIRAVAGLRQRESVPRLVALLGHAHARVRDDAYQALRLLTGIDQGSTRQRWAAWFEGEGATFEVPPLEVALAAEEERQRIDTAEGRTTSFYGLRVDSNHVCFVIDVSGSMNVQAGGGFTSAAPGGPTRLEVAVREISNALRGMLDGARFNVVTFASTAEAFEPSLVTLNDRTRQRALRRVERLAAGGGTALYDALVLALSDPEVDTIFLMTDGRPTVGRLRAPEEIREAVRARNRGRLVRIHGVAVGISSPLLEGLAADTGGQYREIR